MALRITTRGLFRNYSVNLTKSTNRLNDSMEKVQTQRKFNSYAEDPAVASRAFQTRRSYWRTGDQIDNSNYIISKFQTGWTAMDGLIEGNGTNDGGLNGIAEALQGLNDPTASARKSLGQDMVEMAESVVRMMNVQYGDEYVFAGADGLNVPFTWAEDGTTLLYRGIDVNTPAPCSEAEFNRAQTGGFADQPDFADWLGDQDPAIAAADATFDDYKTWFKEEFAGDSGMESLSADQFYNKVSARYGEGTYVDIGIGMKLDENGDVIPTSAFNSALNGLEYLGNGLDEEGDSQNMAVLLRELGTIFTRCDGESGEYASAADRERASELTGKLQDAMTRMIEQHSKLSAQVNYLNTNVEQLTTNKDQLNEQIIELEEIDSADAITQMLWAQYSYNAALRIGTDILSQSLIDYMR